MAPVAHDNNVLPKAAQKSRLPIICPLCHSVRVARVAEIGMATVVCVCEACNAEFVVSPQRGER